MLRIIFMGTPDFAVPALKALVAAGHEVIAAYTQPPRPGGRRGKEQTLTPVHRAAEELGIEVRHPASLKDAAEQAEFAALGADIAVVAAYGLILPQAILDAPTYGCLNIHASLLPRWRGAAPVQRAILAGDEETGISIMQMEAGLDTGPMLAVGRTDILTYDTAGSLTTRLSQMGAELMVKVLNDLPQRKAVVQLETGVTYAKKIEKSEAKLDFAQTASELARRVRAFNPTPVTWLEFGEERIKVFTARAVDRWPNDDTPPGTVLDRLNARTSAPYSASMKSGQGLVVVCGEGYLELLEVQRAGRDKRAVGDLLRGFQIPEGTILN